ncbi:MAG: twin transmembrane helix small protein [Bdellovibrionales bacterium]
MSVLFISAAVLAALSVLGVLILGLVSMVKGGDFNEKYGNRLMQARVGLQGLALLMLALAYFSSQG